GLDLLHVAGDPRAVRVAEPFAEVDVGGGLPRLPLLESVRRHLVERQTAVRARVDLRGRAVARGVLAGDPRVLARAPVGAAAAQRVAAVADVVAKQRAAERQMVAQLLAYVAARGALVEARHARLVVHLDRYRAAGEDRGAHEPAVLDHARDRPSEEQAA